MYISTERKFQFFTKRNRNHLMATIYFTSVKQGLDGNISVNTRRNKMTNHYSLLYAGDFSDDYFPEYCSWNAPPCLWVCLPSQELRLTRRVGYRMLLGQEHHTPTSHCVCTQQWWVYTHSWVSTKRQYKSSPSLLWGYVHNLHAVWFLADVDIPLVI